MKATAAKPAYCTRCGRNCACGRPEDPIFSSGYLRASEITTDRIAIRVCGRCGGVQGGQLWTGQRRCTCPPEPVMAVPGRAAWECPRCKAVNAPFVDQCDCRPGE